MKKKIPLHKKYGSTFFIFPVFLPLAELLPWALTVIAALAAALQVVRRSLWNHKRNRRILMLVSVVCLLAAGTLVTKRMLYTPDVSKGSGMVPPAQMSKLQSFPSADPAPPAREAQPLSLLWRTDSPDQNIAKPAIVGNILMVGTYKATLDALSLADGQRLWTLHKHEQVFCTPSAESGMAFIGEGYHTSAASLLSAISLPAGQPVWERKFRSHLESSPAIDSAHNRLFLAGGETGIWALNMHTGKHLWWAQVGHSDIPPLYANGRLFAAAKLKEDADGSALFTFDPDSGAVLHSTPRVGDPMGNLLAGTNGEMLLGTAIGQVGVKRDTDAGWAHSFAADGTLRWTTKLPAMPLPEGVLSRDKTLLFYTLNNGSLIALHTNDGSVAWAAQVGKAFQTDAALMEDGKLPLLVAVTNEGLVTIRNALNGQEVQHFNIEQGDSYPLYHEGILYITTPYNVRAYQGVRG